MYASKTGPRRKSASDIHSQISPLILPANAGASSQASLRNSQAASSWPADANDSASTVQATDWGGSPMLSGLRLPAETPLPLSSQPTSDRLQCIGRIQS